MAGLVLVLRKPVSLGGRYSRNGSVSCCLNIMICGDLR